jgi:hypothetical protein
MLESCEMVWVNSTRYDSLQRVTDPNALIEIRDETIIRIGREYFLFRLEKAENETPI